VRVQVTHLTYAQLAGHAEKWLRESHPSSAVPVPIEEILEFQYGVDIVPVRDLQRRFGIDGATGADLHTIYVDEWIQESRPGRYRFTLAHEAGHLVLHREIVLELVPASLSDWLDLADAVDEEAYNRMEGQAYSWAGLVLVPRAVLAEMVAAEAQRAREKGFDPDESPDLAVRYIGSALARGFDVSPEVIRRRISFDHLL